MSAADAAAIDEPVAPATESGGRHPPRVRLALRVGITGTRRLPAEAIVQAVLKQHVAEVLELVIYAATTKPPTERQYLSVSPDLRFVSPLAQGADQLAAQVAVDLGFRLECPLPFSQAEYEKDFLGEPDSAEVLSRFRHLLSHASSVLSLDGTRSMDGTGETAYLSVGRTVLANIDVLISIWDGKDSGRTGGTAHITKEAVAAGMPVVWVHATDPAGHRPSLLVGADGVGNQTRPVDDLLSVLTAQLDPPEADTKQLRQYFSEGRPSGSGGIAHDLLRSTVSHGRPKRPRPLPVDFDDPARAPWRKVLGDSCPALTDGLDLRFAAHRAWFSQLSALYGRNARSVVVKNYLLAFGAVALASVSLISHEVPSAALGVLEVTLIIWILASTGKARRDRWHERWLDYRLLAECIRVTTWTAPLGRRAVRLHVPVHESTAPPNSWVAWHWQAIVRATPMFNAQLDAPYLSALWTWVVVDGIGGQVRYHHDNAATLEVVSHRLALTACRLFYVTLGCCVAHVSLDVYARLSDRHSAVVHSAISWIGVLAVVFPALAACAHAILSQTDFETQARRSQAMEVALAAVTQSANSRLSGPDGSRPSWAIRIAADVAIDAMTGELVGWHTSLRVKPPDVPAG